MYPSMRVLLADSALLQACGLVPIVEPEILIDGGHDLSQSSEVAEKVLRIVFAKLEEAHVQLEACLLKIQMIMPGSEAGKASSEEIAHHTVSLLKRCAFFFRETDVV